MVAPGMYELNGTDSLDQPVITIQGDDLTIDFAGALLQGSNDRDAPDEFYGLAILVKDSRRVTIKNLRVHGYKVALMAVNVDSLQLLDSDLSYNYRQRLHSIREREDLSDWLSYHNNEQDEWLRYGAAAYLKQCDHALVRGLRVTGGQNGLMLTQCNDGLFYNNTIHFNSGVGIGLYRSGRNRVMHNRLDWNVRGYSHGFYRRGQDSAGILCYEQSSENVFAYNSATHSGDGFFLWAGQTTMDTGEGGCNDNLIADNDFSHAPTNGVEITFSRNQVIGNRLEECNYGVWGGYSFETLIAGNDIRNNTYGVAIEHGQDNVIRHNFFRDNETGIQLWQRESQPADWGYAQNRDVSSRNYTIAGNLFVENDTPLRISRTDRVAINDDNQFFAFEKLLETKQPNSDFFLVKNDIFQATGFGDARNVKAMNRLHEPLPPEERPGTDWLKVRRGEEELPPPLADGMDAMLPEDHLRGRHFILVEEWGPYDFRRPAVWLQDIKDDEFIFLLLGPVGNWKVVGGEGFSRINPKTGALPATVRAWREADAQVLRLDFEFIGEQVITQFGDTLTRGTIVPFRFERLEVPVNWQVSFYNYGEELDPLAQEEAFLALKKRQPDFVEQRDALDYRWWGSPAEGVNADRFATFAEGRLTVPPGRYRLRLTSDDGARLYLDGNLLIDHWDIHEPAVDEVEVELTGIHTINVEHFEAGGLGTLDLKLDLR